MSPTSAWQAPEPEPGPAAGTSFATPGLAARRLHPRHHHPVRDRRSLGDAGDRLRCDLLPARDHPVARDHRRRQRRLLPVLLGTDRPDTGHVGDEDQGRPRRRRRAGHAGPAILRLIGLLDRPCRVLHRRHLDLRRQAQARLAGPHRRHGRRRACRRPSTPPDAVGLTAPGARPRWYPDGRRGGRAVDGGALEKR